FPRSSPTPPWQRQQLRSHTFTPPALALSRVNKRGRRERRPRQIRLCPRRGLWHFQQPVSSQRHLTYAPPSPLVAADVGQRSLPSGAAIRWPSPCTAQRHGKRTHCVHEFVATSVGRSARWPTRSQS